MGRPQAVSAALTSSRWTVLALAALAGTASLQLLGLVGTGVVLAVNLPSGLILTGLAASALNGAAAFVLVGASAAATRTDDPEALARAITLRTVGFALLAPATLTWVWLVALSSITATL